MTENLLLHFRTSYFTEWGQHVAVCGAGPVFGNWTVATAQWLTCRHVGEELLWEGLIPVPAAVREVSYRLAVVNEQLQVVKWASEAHTMELPAGLEDGSVVTVDEVWTDASHPAHLLSRSAFTKVILTDRSTPSGAQLAQLNPNPHEAIVRFKVWDLEVREGEQVCIMGGAAQLGNWQLQQVLPLVQTGPSCWEVAVQLPATALPCTYKYGVRQRDASLLLEHGENRMVALPAAGGAGRAPALLLRHDGFFRRQQRWRGAGVAVPVFSLRTATSLGSGEFLDLLPLVDFCEAVGLRLIQLLPVSDTSVRCTWRDSYPYSSLCVFALHPLYLRLEALADELPSDIAGAIVEQRAALDLPDVDYEATMAAKLQIAHRIFDAQGKQALESSAFKDFCTHNWEWLRPYAVFGFLRGLFGTSEHWRWGALGEPNAEVLDRIASPEREWHASIQFTYWLQYHLHSQLLQVSQYAQQRRVVLKGDLPIGVDKRSVDAWLYPQLFRMNVSTGAPPDYFDSNGQNWGFPTYNWEEMAKDGYLWWRRRLAHMAQYFHAYRIDHILGFFRIWEIPGDCTAGILGHFRPSLPLTRQELESHGIWDFERLCEPFITRELLEQTFGALAEEVACRYLQEGPHKRLRLRPQYASEEAIAAILPRPGLPVELVAEVDAIRAGLLALRQNLVLLHDADNPDAFYPRIALMETSSFKDLEPSWRQALEQLHEDYFFRRQDALWREQSHRTLPALMGATDMLVCGEDLGMIPACVHPVMEELGLVGLRIQRMPSESGVEFGDPASYAYTVVASPSSHDTSTTRGWWEQDEERRQRYYHTVLGREGSAPPTCTPEIMQQIIRQHAESPAIFAVFPLQDVMAMSATYATRPAAEETINDPTNPRHYWRYRMHVQLEELQQDQQLQAVMQDVLLQAERCL